MGRDIESHLRWLESHLDRINREIDEKIRSGPSWREKDDLLRGVPGVGPVLGRTLPAIANAILRDEQPWGPGRQAPAPDPA